MASLLPRIIVLLSSLVFIFISIRDQIFMRRCFTHVSYYILLALFLCWVYALVQFWKAKKFSLPLFVKKYAVGVITAFLMSTVIFISVEKGVRVLNDETNVLSIAKSMTYEKRVYNMTQGRWSQGMFHSLDTRMEKRPLLTPFLYHLAHVFLGYNTNRAFVINFIALFFLFVLIYKLAADAFGALAGFTAILLSASQPILSICATSTGIDFLNLVFIVFSIMTLRTYLKEPSKEAFLFLWMTLALLCHARYESVLFMTVFIAALFILKQVKLDTFSHSRLYALTPVFFMPIVWQRILKWHDRELPGASVPTAFELGYMRDHHMDFFRSLVRWDYFLPFANPVNILGLVAIVYFFWRVVILRKSLTSKEDRLFTGIISFSLLLLWMIITAYHFGRVDHPVSSRFFIVFCVTFAVLMALMLADISKKINKGTKVLIPVLAAGIFLLYHPIAMQDRFSSAIPARSEHKFVLNFLKHQPDKNFLLISDPANQFTPYNYGSIEITRANKRFKQVFRQYKNRLYRDVFVVQDIDMKTGKPAEGQELDKRYQLKTISELQVRKDVYRRISQLVNKR